MLHESHCHQKDTLTSADVEAYLAAGKHERRYKLLSICETQILDVLGYRNVISLPTAGQIPADAEVQAVSYDFGSRCFQLRVWSAEFPIVPDGERIPVMGPIQMETLSIFPPPIVYTDPSPEEMESLMASMNDSRNWHVTIPSEIVPVYSPEQVAAMTKHWSDAVEEKFAKTNEPKFLRGDKFLVDIGDDQDHEVLCGVDEDGFYFALENSRNVAIGDRIAKAQFQGARMLGESWEAREARQSPIPATEGDALTDFFFPKNP